MWLLVIWLLKYLIRIPLAIIAFFYRLLRDWWKEVWKKLRPKVVNVVGWGVFATIVLVLLTVAPDLTAAVLHLVIVIVVLYFLIYKVFGNNKKKKK